MRQALVLALGALIALALLPSPVGANLTAPVNEATCVNGEAPLFAGGTTPLVNGFFFPGTGIKNGRKIDGLPYEVPKGCNISLINLDAADLVNAHRIVSYKKRRGIPRFASPSSRGPTRTLMITEHLKPGKYPYYCSTHTGMYGILKIVRSS